MLRTDPVSWRTCPPTSTAGRWPAGTPGGPTPSRPLSPATAFTDGWAYRLCSVAGAVCVQLRLLANLLDGMVAVASNRTSKLGELFNEFPDRLSDAATLIGLGYA